jgi:hypothetical protein
MHPMSPLRGAVLHRSPGHRLRQATSSKRLEVIQHRPDLGVGWSVVAVPSDHPSGIPPHLVTGISQVRHQLRIASQHLHVAAVQAGRVAFPQQVGHCCCG